MPTQQPGKATMKLTRIALLYALLACQLVGQASHAQSVVKLCYEDADNFPWGVKGGHGLNNDLIEMAAARSGLKVEMLALPWKRCLSDVGYGTQAGGFAASFNEERASFAVYPTTNDGKLDPSRRMKFDGYSLYRLRGSAVGWDGKQFSNLTGAVAVQLGYSVAADLRKLGATVDEAPIAAETLMKMLVAGRVPLIAMLTFEGDDLVDNPEFSGKVEKIAVPFSEKPYFLIFNKEYYSRNKKAVEDLWAGLAVARESKEFKALKKERMKK